MATQNAIINVYKADKCKYKLEYDADEVSYLGLTFTLFARNNNWV